MVTLDTTIESLPNWNKSPLFFRQRNLASSCLVSGFSASRKRLRAGNDFSRSKRRAKISKINSRQIGERLKEDWKTLNLDPRAFSLTWWWNLHFDQVAERALGARLKNPTKSTHKRIDTQGSQICDSCSHKQSFLLVIGQENSLTFFRFVLHL